MSSSKLYSAREIMAFEDKAKSGDSKAQYQLAKWCEERGDLEEARMWYDEAAKQGHVDARYDSVFARVMDFGGYRTVEEEKFVKEAVQRYEKRAAQQDAEALTKLGWYYYYLDMNEDKGTALGYFRKAAAQGYAAAPFFLAETLLFGNKYYGNKDNEGKDGEGKAVEENGRQAIDLLEHAAEQRYIPAFYHLGLCYEEGRGVDKDIAVAMEYYQDAAMYGNVDAHYKLGLYYEAKGPHQDLQKVVNHYEMAGARGFISVNAARYDLALCYHNGEGGYPKDLGEALALYQEAAALGHALAGDHVAILKQTIREAWQAVFEQKGPGEQLGLLDTKRKELGLPLDIALDEEGTTPLEWFMHEGNTDMVTRMVQAGAPLCPREGETEGAYIKCHTRSPGVGWEAMQAAVNRGRDPSYTPYHMLGDFLVPELADKVNAYLGPLEQGYPHGKREYGQAGEEKISCGQGVATIQESDEAGFFTRRLPPHPAADRVVVVHEDKDQGETKQRLERIRKGQQGGEESSSWTKRVQTPPPSPAEGKGRGE